MSFYFIWLNRKLIWIEREDGSISLKAVKLFIRDSVASLEVRDFKNVISEEKSFDHLNFILELRNCRENQHKDRGNKKYRVHDCKNLEHILPIFQFSFSIFQHQCGTLTAVDLFTFAGVEESGSSNSLHKQNLMLPNRFPSNWLIYKQFY